MKAALLVGGCALSVLAQDCALAQPGSSAPTPLLGTRKLVSVTREAIPSGENIDLSAPVRRATWFTCRTER